MLHHRLLIGFLYTSLGNTVKKIRHLQGIPQPYKHFVYFYNVYFIYGTNKKNVLQKEIKDFTFEVSNLSTHFFLILFYKDQTFIISTQRGGGEVLKFVTCF